jgi:hypothetical protein
VRFLWEPDNASAISLADSSVIFSVFFEVISDEFTSTQIGFTDNVTDPPFQIEFANSNYDILSVNTYIGTIEILSKEIITSLNDISPKLNIYPNPFNEFIQIYNPDGFLDYILIFDSQGALIEKLFGLKKRFIKISLSGSYGGIYLIKIKKGEKFMSRKIVKN